MSDNFSDLALLANNKLIDKTIQSEKKKEVLNELLAYIDAAISKSDEIPMSSRLQNIIKNLTKVGDELHEYILDKSR